MGVDLVDVTEEPSLERAGLPYGGFWVLGNLCRAVPLHQALREKEVESLFFPL